MPADPIKEWLEDLKEAACAAYEIAHTYTTSGMGMTSTTPIVQYGLLVADTKSSTLVNPNLSPSFVPPDAGSNYTPIDSSGFSLAQFSSVLKEEACDALRTYCDGDTNEAASHVRRLKDIIPGYEEAIGVT